MTQEQRRTTLYKSNEAPDWPLGCYNRTTDYPENVRRLIRRFYEILWKGNPCGTVFGRSFRIPLFLWYDANGLNSCHIVPCERKDEEYARPFPLAIYVNNVSGPALEVIGDAIDLERRWSSKLPDLNGELAVNDINEDLEIFVASSEVEAAGRHLMKFLGGRLHGRSPGTKAIEFLQTDPLDDKYFHTIAGRSLLR